MNVFAKLVTVLSVPIGLINILGGIVAGIWLAILGEWGIIGYGIATSFVSGIGLGLGIAMMPGLLFAAPAVALHEKGNKIGFYVFGRTLHNRSINSLVYCSFILLRKTS